MDVWVMMHTRGCRCVILGGHGGRVDGLPSADRYVMFVILVVGTGSILLQTLLYGHRDRTD